MDIDVALGGMDQRKAHMYMRDVADKWGWPKATCLHTPILSAERPAPADSFDHKMSKSDPKEPCSCSSIRSTQEEDAIAYLDPQDPQSPVYELLEHGAPATGTITITPDPRFGEPSTLEGLEAFKEAVGTGPFIHSTRSSLWQMHSRHSSPPFVRPLSGIPDLGALARWLE